MNLAAYALIWKWERCERWGNFWARYGCRVQQYRRFLVVMKTGHKLCDMGKSFLGLRFHCPRGSWILESLTNPRWRHQTWGQQLSPDSFLLNMAIVMYVETSRNFHSLIRPNHQSRFNTMNTSRWSRRTNLMQLLTCHFSGGPKRNRKQYQSR